MTLHKLSAGAGYESLTRPALSTYERGTKSPTLAVVKRTLHTLGLNPRVTFREVHDGHGATYRVPDRLWHVAPPACFAPGSPPSSAGAISGPSFKTAGARRGHNSCSFLGRTSRTTPER